MSRRIAIIICSLYILISHCPAIGQGSASISATATVVNPVGFKTVSETDSTDGMNGRAGIIIQNQNAEQLMVEASFGSGLFKAERQALALWPGNDTVNIEYYENWLILKTVNTDLNARSITLTLVCAGN